MWSISAHLPRFTCLLLDADMIFPFNSEGSSFIRVFETHRSLCWLLGSFFSFAPVKHPQPRIALTSNRAHSESCSPRIALTANRAYREWRSPRIAFSGNAGFCELRSPKITVTVNAHTAARFLFVNGRCHFSDT